jgi:abortive infection bacteriophage resistance protein
MSRSNEENTSEQSHAMAPQPLDEKACNEVDICSPINHNTTIEVTTPLNDVPRGDSFFSDFLSPQQHISLLKQRGLLFKNHYEEERLERLLATIGYYKLSQYFKHFYISPKARQFKAETTSKHIITAYRQNERLRTCLIDALLKIEAKLKTQLTEALINQGQDIYWVYNPNYGDLKLLEKATEKNNRRYKAQATHLFYEQYPNHVRLPAWVVMQAHEFGTLCQLMRHEHVPKRVLIYTFKQFGMQAGVKSFHFIKMFDALRHVRNLCVHHEKLLGEHIRIAPPVWSELDPKMAHRLDNTLFWIEHLLKSVTLRGSFANAMQQIISTVNTTCPESLHIKLYRPLLEVEEEAE